MTDEQAEASDVRVFNRLIAAGLSIERIEQHLTAGRVRVEGVRPVTARRTTVAQRRARS
jgi:hypothetical protein